MSSKDWPPYTRKQIEDLVSLADFKAEYQGQFDPQKPARTLYVMAGNYHQFRYLCRLMNTNPRKAVFVWDEQSLRGRQGETLIRYGTWYEQRHADEIMRIAEVLGWTIQDWKDEPHD